MNSWRISLTNIFWLCPLERLRTNNTYRSKEFLSTRAPVSNYISHWKQPGALRKVGWFQVGAGNVQEDPVTYCHTRSKEATEDHWAVTKGLKHTGAKMQRLLPGKDGTAVIKDGYKKNSICNVLKHTGSVKSHTFITVFAKLMCSLCKMLGKQLIILETGT